MNSVTIKLISPSGVMMDLAIPAKEEDKGIIALLDRAEDTAKAIVNRGDWHLAEAKAMGPSVAELDSVPRFGGYECSPTVGDNGFPTYIIANGKRADRREKQGDVWYSYPDDSGAYVQVLRIPKGEKVA